MDLLKKVKNVFSKKKDLGRILEINIHGFGWEDDYISVEEKEGEKLFIAFLKDLYTTVLNKDPNWHYFIEGSFNHIRISEKFKDEFLDIMRKHKARCKPVIFEWKDEQAITKKYQPVFKLMFHAFSEMAMQNYDEDEFNMILDRVIHCFMNHQMLFIPELRKEHGNMTEPILIARNAVKRAEFIGYILGMNRVNREKAEALDKLHADHIEDYNKYQEDLKEQFVEMLKLMEKSDEPLTVEDIKDIRKNFEKAWDKATEKEECSQDSQ